MVKQVDGSVHRIWYEEPELWAQEQDSRVAEEGAFLDEVFQEHNLRSVLDAGCGAGSHCNYLQQRGYVVSGFDLNEKLVSFAKKHYPKIHFFVANQTTYSIKEPVDAIYSLCTVLSYAITNEEVFQTLKNHYNSLKEGGLLVISTFNPIVFIDKVTYLHEKKDATNALGYYAIRKYSVDESRQLSIDEATFYDEKTGNIISSDKSLKRMLFPQEIKFFLEQAGFKVLSMNSGFDKNHTILDGHYMTIIAQKTN